MAEGYVDESGRIRWADQSELAELTLEGTDRGDDDDEQDNEEEEEDSEGVSGGAVAKPRVAAAATGR